MLVFPFILPFEPYRVFSSMNWNKGFKQGIEQAMIPVLSSVALQIVRPVESNRKSPLRP